MIPRILLAFLLKLCLDLPLMVIGWFAVPVALHFERDNHLPAWAEWCWGNRDHGNDGESFYAKLTPGWSRFRRCYTWLAFRNPTFNWSKYILGFKSDGKARIVKGDIYPIGDTKAEGWYYARERWAWEVYYIKAYTLLGVRRCLRFRCGWKIAGKKAGEVAQFCFVPNPLHSYTGK